MRYESIKQIRSLLGPLLKKYEVSESSIYAHEKVQLQNIYKFIHYDKSKIFPYNPSKEWDADTFGSVATCQSCFRNLCTELTKWYNLKLK